MCAFRLLTAIAAIAAIAAPALAQDIDPRIRPGDDFYGYANARWLKAEPLPEGVSSFGTTAALIATNAARVHDLIAEAAAAPRSGLSQKIGDYYASLNDTGAIEARGLAPLATDLAAIAAIKDRPSLSVSLGHYLYLDGTNSHTEGLLGIWGHQGFHDPDYYVPHRSAVKSTHALADLVTAFPAWPESPRSLRRLYCAVGSSSEMLTSRQPHSPGPERCDLA